MGRLQVFAKKGETGGKGETRMKRPPEKPSHTLPGGTWSNRGKGLPSLAHASDRPRCPGDASKVKRKRCLTAY